MPDYPKPAQLWWQNVSLAVTKEKTPEAAMNDFAEQMDDVLGRLARTSPRTRSPSSAPILTRRYIRAALMDRRESSVTSSARNPIEVWYVLA